jgi:ribosome modulation factor
MKKAGNLTYTLAYNQGIKSKKHDKNPYSKHTAPEWYEGWKDGHNLKHGKTCELKEKLIENAHKALDDIQSEEGNINAMYNVLRYAKAGLYQLKG